MKYDFSGWATRNDLTCSDGRVIKKDAFKHNDGEIVPLVWNHQHNNPDNVLGHAMLENREDGVYAYCEFNDSESGITARKLVEHGDVRSLSIFANQLKESGKNVLHGVIREVSLVLAGANPGAFIESVIAHGADSETGLIIGYDENIMLYHSSDNEDEKDKKDKEDTAPDKKENKEDGDDKETIQDVFDSMSEKQQKAVYAMLAQTSGKDGGESQKDDKKEEKDDEKKGGNKIMKHNVFDNDDRQQRSANVICHSDQVGIVELAKNSRIGSFKNALKIYFEENRDTLAHSGIENVEDFLAHGIDNIDVLFPEYKDVRPGAPELLTTDQGWIAKVLSKVHKSPISRIRTRQADIRNIEKLRAQGYDKGNKKKIIGNFQLLHRTTDPQTVYVKSELDRDDVIDITDFDVIAYLYGIDRMNLNEELATAIMLGDGREDGTEGKIYPDKIRPVWTDDELYTIHADVDIDAAKKELQGTSTGANFGENYIYAEAVIQSLLYAREQYKGSGTPDFYCTPHLRNVMLLARDLNGRRIYHNVTELAAALDVGEIITAEQFEGKIRTTSNGKTKKLLGLMYNLADYSLGATKGGEITHFTDFDIDFNKEKSLLETRTSGANTRVMSAIALEEDITGISNVAG